MVSAEAGRRRAPAMSAADRREAIVAATLPLLVEHGGGSVSTSQIAAAAGIAEGTVFRVFKDKRELYVACLRAELRSGEQTAEIEAIPQDQPLAARLIAGVDLVSGYQRRMWSIIEAFRADGLDIDRKDFVDAAKDAARANRAEDGDDGDCENSGGGPEHGFHTMARTISILFGDDRGNLRVEPELAARLLLGLMFTNHMEHERLGGGKAEPAELVDLFLHGALRATSTGDTGNEGEEDGE